MDKSAFKCEDQVYYGVIHGLLLGIFGDNQALFMSDHPKSGFKTINAIHREVGPPFNNACRFYVNRHFNSERPAIYQNRFMVVPLSDLKKDDDRHKPYKALQIKRHHYLVMARSYLRNKQPDLSLERVCDKIIELQVEIERIEEKAKAHLQHKE